ncbi:MAG: gamma-glutamyl-gamma-aminobutyrate hydrolase family protein [Oscillospiraceae bacterium]|nr:gamma-glutamyl-gamma-aminobutyrate hydrolase family protein [Oscillospiraceae bacterium]
MKPIIGIFPSYNEEKNQVFLNQSYFDAIIESGGIPVALPLLRDEEIISEIVKRFDGIILSGGSDIDPKHYNQINSGKSLEINSFRDESEEKIIRILIESDIPVLGICRGMQDGQSQRFCLHFRSVGNRGCFQWLGV